MVCIYCGNETDVYNSRPKARTPSVWRRRRCNACVAQFTTTELPEYESSLIVEYPDGSCAAFSRDRIFLSLYKALGHREDALPSATHLTKTVIAKTLRGQHGPQIHARIIARAAYATLKRYDVLSSKTYQAYHQALLT